MTTKLTKEVEHALKWLAAEFKFLKRLNADLERIEKESLKQQEKDLKKDIKVIRYIGGAERRLQDDVSDIIEEIKKSKKKGISLNEIEVPAAKLLKEGSIYVGNLKDQLNTIRTSVRLQEKYPKEETRVIIQKEIEKLESKVSTLMTWITALAASLKKVEKLTEPISEEIIIRYPRKIQEVISEQNKDRVKKLVILQADSEDVNYILKLRMKLKALLLRVNVLDQDIINIVKSSDMESLEELSLEYTKITNLGASAIAKSKYMKNLKILRLYYTKIDDEAIRSIVDSKYLLNLTWLDLHANRGISNLTAQYLMEDNALPALKIILLQHCRKISPDYKTQLKAWAKRRGIELHL